MKKCKTQNKTITVTAAAVAKTIKRGITFTFPADAGHNVFLAGSFNDWQERKMSYKDGVYSLKLMLSPGEYQYKFLVDGEWHLDDANENFTPNGFGTLNSVLIVKEK